MKSFLYVCMYVCILKAIAAWALETVVAVAAGSQQDSLIVCC